VKSERESGCGKRKGEKKKGEKEKNKNKKWVKVEKKRVRREVGEEKCEKKSG
jgi:hypothetical protein